MQEITKPQERSFYLNGPTIFAGTILDNEYIVQVYTSGVRILDKGLKGKKKTKLY